MIIISPDTINTIDTICAISTALGVGAISIIRVSGEDAIRKVALLFDGKNLEEVKSHTIHYGHIVYHGEVIDEVLVSVLKAPKTYTKEELCPLPFDSEDLDI